MSSERSVDLVDTEDSRHLKTDLFCTKLHQCLCDFEHLQLSLTARAKYCQGDEKEDQGIQTAEELLRNALDLFGPCFGLI